ncbi:hypothetical protein B0J11DRAFT_497086 [Dendryphion nanum]|uniref:DUF3176 domain containing protein n=1 Tax=Dendryphion nanum TaxID=256645 RepID=A0A9P9D6U3_9PLEO|nr:hypothetical protein B0J11DRAFT_497086 [Dendryphion nanum]
MSDPSDITHNWTYSPNRLHQSNSVDAPPSYRVSISHGFSGASSTTPHLHHTLHDIHTPPRRPRRVDFRTRIRFNPQKSKPQQPEPVAGLGLNTETWNRSSLDDEKPPLTRSENTNFAQWIEKKVWQYNASGGVVRRWILEIISWSISALCMIAIVIMLLLTENQKSPSWPLSQIFNTLSRVASAALILPVSEALGQLKWNWFQNESKKMWDFEIFDNASRGPWGSALLLIRTKGRTLASLGAAVTLLALALDPFFQQVTELPLLWTATGNSSVPRVLHYRPVFQELFVNGIKQASQDQNMLNMASQFFWRNGTYPAPFGNTTRAEIPIVCPTSNCTWDPYQTLGYCSACADISNMLEFACMESQIDWTSNTQGKNSAPVYYPNATACGYFLNRTSSNPILMSGYLVNSTTSARGEALLMRSMNLVMQGNKERLYDGSINFKSLRNPVIDFLMVTAGDGTPDSVYQNKTPVAHECVLSWCVQTIKSSYFYASYKEEIVEKFFNTTPGQFAWTSNRTTVNGTNVTWQTYTQNVSIKLDPTTENPQTTFNLSAGAAFNIINSFEEYVPNFYTVLNASAPPILRHRVHLTTGIFTRKIEINPFLYPNNITRHMERFATVLTNQMRSGEANLHWVTGTAFSQEIFVHVHWAWLTLPLLILLLSLVFLMETVRQTAKDKDNIGVWKSSALATLVYGGMSEEIRQQMKEGVGTPRTQARKMKARLLPNQEWRVSGTMSGQLSPRTMQGGARSAPPGWI